MTKIPATMARFSRLVVLFIFLTAVISAKESASARPPIFNIETIKENDPGINATSLEPSKLSFQEAATGLDHPVFITNAADGSDRVFIVEQSGYIRILNNNVVLGTPFLDVHSIIKYGGEQGLLALAFHPSYETNGFFYIVYTGPRIGDATGSNLVLKRYSVSSGNSNQADSNSGVELLTISHPVETNHNGGTLAFGGDGYLYWSTGDGGGGGDPSDNAQQLNNLLGKIIRIDVNSGSPYGIPTTNPFYSSSDTNIKKEIWAYGLRNPWRISFDKSTSDLYIGDVGQSVREEVDFQPASSLGGENYGWRVMEGSICYNPSSGCSQSGKILPVAEYDHTLGCSITGGHVYRGSKYPSLNGYYFYGDYCSGRFFSLRNESGIGWTTTLLADTAYKISTFGEDEDGEIFLADLNSGKIYNIQYVEPPHVVSILRAGSNPSNASTVNFTVTFSEAVVNVDTNDFNLTTNSVIGASITAISGSGATRTVTVNTGSRNGTIRLNTQTSASINDLTGNMISNAPFTSGETYTINKLFIQCASICLALQNSNVDFTVTFLDAVIDVDTGDFEITATGLTGFSITEVTGSGSTRTVTVNTGSGNGTLRLDIPASATITEPISGLPFTTGESYTVVSQIFNIFLPLIFR